MKLGFVLDAVFFDRDEQQWIVEMVRPIGPACEARASIPLHNDGMARDVGASLGNSVNLVMELRGAAASDRDGDCDIRGSTVPGPIFGAQGILESLAMGADVPVQSLSRAKAIGLGSLAKTAGLIADRVAAHFGFPAVGPDALLDAVEKLIEQSRPRPEPAWTKTPPAGFAWLALPGEALAVVHVTDLFVHFTDGRLWQVDEALAAGGLFLPLDAPAQPAPTMADADPPADPGTGEPAPAPKPAPALPADIRFDCDFLESTPLGDEWISKVLFDSVGLPRLADVVANLVRMHGDLIAGFVPSDVTEGRALVLWYQRNWTVALLPSGSVVAIGPALVHHGGIPGASRIFEVDEIGRKLHLPADDLGGQIEALSLGFYAEHAPPATRLVAPPPAPDQPPRILPPGVNFGDPSSPRDPTCDECAASDPANYPDDDPIPF